jgi:AcrR family transcriptional regulator
MRQRAGAVDVRRKARAGPAGPQIRQGLERLLRTEPFAELSVERICSEASVTRATYYHYYGSKHAALAALAGELWDDVFAEIHPFVSGGGEDPPQLTIRDSFGAAWQIWLDHAPVFHALATSWEEDPELQELWIAIIDRFTTEIAAEIDRERAAGTAPPGPDSHQPASVLLWSTAHCLHVAGSHANAHMPDEAGLFDTMMTVWLRSIYGDA